MQFKWVESTGTRNISSKNLPKINEFYKKWQHFYKNLPKFKQERGCEEGKEIGEGKRMIRRKINFYQKLPNFLPKC